VIRTKLQIGGVQRLIEVTLTRRDEMGFRMLIGREALRGTFGVEPNRSFVAGVPPAEGQRAAFLIGGVAIPAGKRDKVALPISKLASGTQINLPVLVIHGSAPGPTVWLSAAVHGDELNGVDIIRRVLEQLDPKTLRGTVLAVPTVNVHGFVSGERYLPDRRDLNRSFPGSARGSLARRIAYLFMTEVVARCSAGIDLHTGSDGRTNLPQIRADLSCPETERLASAFGCALMLHSKPIEKTLRHAATKVGAKVLLFEGGEALRFDRFAIDAGTSGVLRVLSALDLIDPVVPAEPTQYRGEDSQWVRARRSGLAQVDCGLGELVEKGQLLGRINDSLGKRLSQLKSPYEGIVVGLKIEPLVHRGDAIVHVAAATATQKVSP
jgi:predicted deacylase